MIRTTLSALVVGATGAVAVSTEAGGVFTGARAFLTGASTRSDEAPGSAEATYLASVNSLTPEPNAFASANLVWGAASYAFTGTASGVPGQAPLPGFGYVPTTQADSQGIATFTFATDMDVTMSWNLSSVAGKSAYVIAGWTLDNAVSGATAYAIQFDGGLAPTTVGGIPGAASASGVTGRIVAGTYILATAVQVDVATSGNFTVNLTFTTVPSPGALPLVAVATLVSRRGRRR